LEKVKNKDGTGRSAMYHKFGVIRSYTIEANYNMCNRKNRLIYDESRLDSSRRQLYIEGVGEQNPLLPNIGEICRGFNFETDLACHHITIRDLRNTGKEICHALLDSINLNPFSRLRNTPLKNIRVSLTLGS
jgi:hypothetical protein